MFNKSSWNLILVNYINPIPCEFIPSLDKIRDEYLCKDYLIDKKIKCELLNMFEDSKKCNANISIFSGYRDIKKQIRLVNNSIKKKINNRYSIKDARNLCFETLAIPGFSEHHTGLAIDVYSNNDNSFDNTNFENTFAYNWLINNSYKYGFILRYPKGKEHITNISFEPWHFRYVGKEASKVIYEENICLEEFIEKYT